MELPRVVAQNLPTATPRMTALPKVSVMVEPLTSPRAGLHDCTALVATMLRGVGPASKNVFSAPHVWE